ncbi:MAG: annexin VII [Meiothermus sp.]|uniref:annexin VII n=1 Tax=Meiothermus sp. TaxID=1955249 RepID=UPI0025EE0502|nr:annexin VII [Meiothermus sp.]MCS7069234.1 annexin VII [Meiothermus sp.]MDW8424330.1 annexin VII [Meiothermus sp.]
MNAEFFRRLPYSQAEPEARRVLVDGYGEGLVMEDSGGLYALYYLFGLLGLREPIPSHPRTGWKAPGRTPRSSWNPTEWPTGSRKTATNFLSTKANRRPYVRDHPRV